MIIKRKERCENSTFEKSYPTYNILKEDYFMVVDATESKYRIGIIEFLDVIDEASVESSKRNVNIIS